MFRHASMVGIVIVVFYVICLLWQYTISDPAVAQFHLLSLKLILPGFSGYTGASIVWGAVLSFVYGFAGSLIFHGLHKNCCKMK